MAEGTEVVRFHHAHGVTLPPGALPGEASVATVASIQEVAARATESDGATVLLLSRALLHATAGDSALHALPEEVVVVALDAEALEAAERTGRLFLSIDGERSTAGARRALRAAALHAARCRGEARSRLDLERLQTVGLSLLAERRLDSLLGRILAEVRRLTASDAGSLFLAERGDDGATRLRFLLAQNASIPDLALTETTLEIDDHSIAGHAALHRCPLRIDDVRDLPADAPFVFREELDRAIGYHSRSMLVVPLENARRELVGVLQLVNKTRRASTSLRDEESARAFVVPYDDADVHAAHVLAGHAAVAIETARLQRAIERLFEGFITAAVTAIEQRDPVTSGHSLRVATLSCELAAAVDRVSSGPLGTLRFGREQLRELRYAALLHDFGKVGVRESVLNKAKKLPPVMEERIRGRFRTLRALLLARQHEQRAAWLVENGSAGFELAEKRIAAEIERERAKLDAFERALETANEPSVLPESTAAVLADSGAIVFSDADGKLERWLAPEELRFVSLPRGSLDDEEREEIESHVVHTHRFLSQIPWTDELGRVPEIAYGHHEKLDGSGYPRGMRGPAIAPATRVLTVADIFDALTAGDRPYKPGLPPERALDILRSDAKAGRIEGALVDLLVDSGLWRSIVSPRA